MWTLYIDGCADMLYSLVILCRSVWLTFGVNRAVVAVLNAVGADVNFWAVYKIEMVPYFRRCLLLKMRPDIHALLRFSNSSPITSSNTNRTLYAGLDSYFSACITSSTSSCVTVGHVFSSSCSSPSKCVGPK